MRELRKVHYSKANDEFYKATGFKISDFFEFKEKEMEQFIKMKKQMFVVDDRGYVRAIDYNE